MGTRFPISILVADDHPVIREGLVALLRSHSDFNVVSACCEGTAAVQAIRALAPEIAILDMRMPGLSGIDILSRIAAEGMKTKVIFFIASMNERQIHEAIARRARGIILKDAEPDELVKCIRAVAAGEIYFPRDLVEATFEPVTKRQTESESALTERERQVVNLVSEGLSNKEVARKLQLSDGTIKVHLHNIYEKLGIVNRTALAAFTTSHREPGTVPETSGLPRFASNIPMPV